MKLPRKLTDNTKRKNQDMTIYRSSSNKNRNEHDPQTTEEMFRQFFQLYNVALWTIGINVIFFIAGIFLAVALFTKGTSLVQGSQSEAIRVSLGIFLLVFASVMLITLVRYQPLKIFKKEIKGFIRMNIIYYNYVKQMESISALWEAIDENNPPQAINKYSSLLNRIDQLTASTIGELDSIDDLQEK